MAVFDPEYKHTGLDRIGNIEQYLVNANGGSQPARLLNVATGNPLPSFAKAIARVRSNGGDAKILCIGDSTTAGVGSDGNSNQGGPYSFPYRLAVALNGFISAATGLGVPPSVLGSGSPDSRWTMGTGWTSDVHGWANGADMKGAPSAAGNGVFADTTVIADRFDIYYLTNTTTGTLTAQATGGTSTPTNTAGTKGVAKVTLSAASAATTNTVTFSNASVAAGGVHVIGVEPWLSTVSKVRVANAGVGSSKTSDWNGDSTGFGGIPSIKLYAPDLTIISLGINDASVAIDVATYTANVQALVAAAQVSGDVILLPPIPSRSDVGGTYLTYEPLYAAAEQSLGLPYGDLYTRFGQPGSIDTSLYFDTRHLNALGYSSVSNWLARALCDRL